MNKYTEEEILKKLGYVIGAKKNQTIVLYNPTRRRTIYLFEDNSFVVGIGSSYFVGHFISIVRTTPTFKEKRLIKKLIKLRKEKTNENN